MIAAMITATTRITKRDVAIATIASLLGLLLMVMNVEDEAVQANVLAVPLFLAVTVPLAWRRAAPIAAGGAALAGLLAHLALFGTDLIRCGVVLPMAFLLAFAAGTQLELREARFGLAFPLGLIATEGAYFLGTFGLVFAALAVAIWGIGRVVRSRGRMVDELGARTEELREVRDERARLEVATDRARISGELDALLQRRLGALAQLADDGSRPTDPAAATATLVDIERESRSTLEQMRAVVGVLRDAAPGTAASPQPTLTHLEALLVRAKGADAHLTVEGSPRVLPPAVELSAYRVVEHLLAALADASDVNVRVCFTEDALELAVSGPARRGARAAIERARERVLLHHGTLEATTRDGRADALACLPVLARV
jgi:hypothetical protein